MIKIEPKADAEIMKYQCRQLLSLTSILVIWMPFEVKILFVGAQVCEFYRARNVMAHMM